MWVWHSAEVKSDPWGGKNFLYAYKAGDRTVAFDETPRFGAVVDILRRRCVRPFLSRCGVRLGSWYRCWRTS